MSIPTHPGCEGTPDPVSDSCPSGSLPSVRMIPGGSIGLNRVHNLTLTSTLPQTHPYGTYVYASLGVPVSLTYQHSSVQFLSSLVDDGGGSSHFQCLKQTVIRDYFFTTADIHATAIYDQVAPPKVLGVSVSMSGTARTTIRQQFLETGEDTTTTSTFSIYHPVFAQTGNGHTDNFGVSIPNTVVRPAGCDEVHAAIFSEGACTVTASVNNKCFDFPPVYRAIPCGSPPPNILSEIFVDLVRVQNLNGTARYPYHSGWPYVLLDELVPNTLETQGVSTNQVQGCFPRVVLCGGGSPLPFDEAYRPLSANSAYFGAFQFYPDGGAWVPGPAGEFDWSLDTCPGPAPLMAAPDDNPLKKKGMVSEAQLEAMGATPEDEARRMRQGGCCSPPEPID
ncbi:MAG: hypothetical protein ACWA5W_04425 [Phycisphaerales bacterium]